MTVLRTGSRGGVEQGDARQPTAEGAPSSQDEVAVIVLAAGRGDRFDAGTKQLAQVAGRPLVAHAVRTAWRGGAGRVLVVVGHDGDAVAAAARTDGRDIEVVVNPDHARGQATSLRAGVAALQRDGRSSTAVVLLADQPGVTPEAVRAVAAAVAQGPACARASYADGPGHPVAFSRRVWDALSDVSGDTGAKELLGAMDVAHVLVAGPVPRDVDTEADLAAVRAALGHGAPE